MVIRKLHQYFNRATLNKLLIFTTDLLLGAGALPIALMLTQSYDLEKTILPQLLAISILLRISAFFGLKTYTFLLRFIHLRDLLRLAIALAFADASLLLLSWFLWYPLRVAFVLAYFILSLTTLAGYRLVLHYLATENDKGEKNPIRLLIFGAGAAGLITKHVLEQAPGLSYKVVAFFDDDPKKSGKTIEGVRIFHVAEHFKDIVRKNKVQKAVIAIHHLSPQRRQTFVDWCIEAGIPVVKVPSLKKWYEGSFDPMQLENIHIEELLEREPISMESPHVRATFSGRTILVTGAAGSIGRELCRQLARLQPRQLLLLDKAESPLHELHLAIEEEEGFPHAFPILADITDQKRIKHIFSTYRPEVILHAAAYKHVPMLENHPAEAIKVNVLGTQYVADAAVEYQAEKFILVSTDKAVNPTNVMGASKRIAELYIQALHAQGSSTAFAITRFGNVLGSDGSVVPRFKKQIQAGGPVTVTSPDVVRYFMTIHEAAQLILEAGAIGKHAEIFLFDMGKPVRILDLARKMILLAGLQPEKDISIVFTGLRPGEKLVEELLLQKENTLPTYHEKIRIAKNVSWINMPELRGMLEILRHLATSGGESIEIVRFMTQLVPEFCSTNPKFAAVFSQKFL